MKPQISDKVSFIRNRLEESQILFLYRYISLLITSIFYFLNNSEHILGKKLFIIGCLTIAAVLLSYLYLIHENSKKNIKLLILIETIGNSILLIPSGGINSPFIWYTINTILISSVFLRKIYCWINLLAYILISGTIIRFGTHKELAISHLIKQESNLILSFIMIVVAVQVWSIYVRKTKEKNIRLEEVNKQLELASQINKESIDHIMTLYQSVNLLSNQGNKEGLLKLFFEYIKKITKTNTVFYYDIAENISKMISDNNVDSLKTLEKNIINDLEKIRGVKTPIKMEVLNSKFMIIAVEANYKDYGILGFEVTGNENNVENNFYQLKFLSELISAAFERFYLEEINERLLITEEQNRIANEIHDSVLQRLFSMSCGVFSLMKKLDIYTKIDIENELNLLRKTTDNVMKELRSKIYGLSWKKLGTNSFITDINKYIDDTKKLNNINIPFSVIGNDELLSCKHKKALYRMICEGVGNAIRHGSAKNIAVTLTINSTKCILNITDDGSGFDINRVTIGKKMGLGINNLNQLAESLLGGMKIDSKLGHGTKIEVMIPTNVLLMEEEEAIV